MRSVIVRFKFSLACQRIGAAATILLAVVSVAFLDSQKISEDFSSEYFRRTSGTYVYDNSQCKRGDYLSIRLVVVKPYSTYEAERPQAPTSLKKEP